MAGSYREILEREFAEEDGSFLNRLRPGMVWDLAAFSRLVAAMEACCEDCEGQETLERWLVEGFWVATAWVKDWTGHPSFPRPEPPEYYAKAIERLDDLALWFFVGVRPYMDGHGFEPL